MKRVDLIKRIKALGCELVRHGGKHDWYRNPTTGVSQPVPRHREIPEGLARHIMRMLANPPTAKSTSEFGLDDSS
jgi:predicted RNA binding protein YcfA (HicA-like mRNA interferase family)